MITGVSSADLATGLATTTTVTMTMTAATATRTAPITAPTTIHTAVICPRTDIGSNNCSHEGAPAHLRGPLSELRLKCDISNQSLLSHWPSFRTRSGRHVRSRRSSKSVPTRSDHLFPTRPEEAETAESLIRSFFLSKPKIYGFGPPSKGGFLGGITFRPKWIVENA